MEMTKDELIKRLIEMRKTGADETLDRVCESSTGCEDCPLYQTGRLCSHQTIDYLLDYIIDNESVKIMTVEYLLKFYRNYDNRVVVRKGDRYIADFYDMDELKAVYGQHRVAEFTCLYNKHSRLVIYLEEVNL